MDSVNFKKTYYLGEIYQDVKYRSQIILGKYLEYPDLYEFDDLEKCIRFKSERLIPLKYTNRPRVMLLFSNPHPHSVHQGMILSPNTRGRENLFWEIMKEAGWINFNQGNREPQELASHFLRADYQGPFDLLFYAYYSFPTRYPKQIEELFGGDYFRKCIEPDALHEFIQTLENTQARAVVTVNKGIYNLVSKDAINLYINRLISNEVIKSHIKGVEREIPIFLTFPTGWRYHTHYKSLRVENLQEIKRMISLG